MPKLKTPGIYIEEIKELPPHKSIPPALPVFIGYTQYDGVNHGTPGDDPLHLVPTFIQSLQEFETVFGGALTEDHIEINLSFNEAANPIATAHLPVEFQSKYLLYYALQWYFGNGGTSCYIVSVNLFSEAPGTIFKQDLLDGINALSLLNNPLLLLFPDAVNLEDESEYYDVMYEAIDYCAQRRDCFTIMDIWLNKNDPATDLITEVNHFRDVFSKRNFLEYAAVYHPWIQTNTRYQFDVNKVKVRNMDTIELLNEISGISIYHTCLDAIAHLQVALPPSAAMAAVYIKTDKSNGTWKAPVAITIEMAARALWEVSDSENQLMNIHSSGKSVNAIRYFNGKGLLPWGSRTLNGNDNEWKYVPVKRTAMMIETGIREIMTEFHFEPNNARTWSRINTMVNNYLIELWRKGALQGSKPEEAFYVKIGPGQTMTQNDIDEGRLILNVGIALIKPAEFYQIRITHLAGTKIN